MSTDGSVGMSSAPTHCTDRAWSNNLVRLVHAGLLTQAIFAAAELRIADLLERGPMDARALARATHCHEPSLRRLMRALASVDLWREAEDGTFALTPTGALLCSQATHSLLSWTLFCGRHLRLLWDALPHSVRTGTTAWGAIRGNGSRSVFDRDAEATSIFNEAMAELTRVIAAGAVRSYDFTGLRRVVDVGGGYGLLLAEVLKTYPTAHGVLLELPHVVDGAINSLTGCGLADRCDFIAGDFFDSIPGAGNVYLLKAVLHDWDDERCKTILRNCRRVMSPAARLVIIERIMPARIEPCPSHRAIAWSDLTMMVGLGGRERTEVDFRRLLAATGFRLGKIAATALDFSVIEGIPCGAEGGK